MSRILLVAKWFKSGMFYVYLIIGSIFMILVHMLSTEYINILYAGSSIDTKYSDG